MGKQKTAMQHHIDFLTECCERYKSDGIREAFKAALSNVESLFELEKQQMQDALNHGLDNHVPKSGLGYRQIAFDKYYNETFETK